jgi:hypothetical protein
MWQMFLTCPVCQGLVNGALTYASDPKYIKAVQGAIGIYCLTQGYGMTTCA